MKTCFGLWLLCCMGLLSQGIAQPLPFDTLPAGGMTYLIETHIYLPFKGDTSRIKRITAFRFEAKDSIWYMSRPLIREEISSNDQVSSQIRSDLFPLKSDYRDKTLEKPYRDITETRVPGRWDPFAFRFQAEAGVLKKQKEDFVNEPIIWDAALKDDPETVVRLDSLAKSKRARIFDYAFREDASAEIWKLYRQGIITPDVKAIGKPWDLSRGDSLAPAGSARVLKELSDGSQLIRAVFNAQAVDAQTLDMLQVKVDSGKTAGYIEVSVDKESRVLRMAQGDFDLQLWGNEFSEMGLDEPYLKARINWQILLKDGNEPAVAEALVPKLFLELPPHLKLRINPKKWSVQAYQEKTNWPMGHRLRLKEQAGDLMAEVSTEPSYFLKKRFPALGTDPVLHWRAMYGDEGQAEGEVQSLHGFSWGKVRTEKGTVLLALKVSGDFYTLIRLPFQGAAQPAEAALSELTQHMTFAYPLSDRGPATGPSGKLLAQKLAIEHGEYPFAAYLDATELRELSPAFQAFKDGIRDQNRAYRKNKERKFLRESVFRSAEQGFFRALARELEVPNAAYLERDATLFLWEQNLSLSEQHLYGLTVKRPEDVLAFWALHSGERWEFFRFFPDKLPPRQPALEAIPHPGGRVFYLDQFPEFLLGGTTLNRVNWTAWDASPPVQEDSLFHVVLEAERKVGDTLFARNIKSPTKLRDAYVQAGSVSRAQETSSLQKGMVWAPPAEKLLIETGLRYFIQPKTGVIYLYNLLWDGEIRPESQIAIYEAGTWRTGSWTKDLQKVLKKDPAFKLLLSELAQGRMVKYDPFSR
ncbi:MAG: hypothetical protein AAFR61_05965 [Bacteroidota bacterium]